MKFTFLYQQYYPKWVKSIVGVLFVAAIVLMVYNLRAGIILLALNIIIPNIYFLSTKNRKGAFLIDDDGFVFKSTGVKKRINYADVWEVRKEYWEEDKQTIGVNYHQYNANQYSIWLKNNNKLTFRVAAKEEKQHYENIKRTTTKVYGKTPMVGLTKNVKRMREKEEKAKEKEYEKIKPETNYSLEKAIMFVVEKGCLSFSDQTLTASD